MTDRGKTLIAAVLAAVLTAVLALSFLSRTEFFNPFDENAHYDYVVRIAQTGSAPARTTILSQQALQDWACSSVLGFDQLACGADTQDPANAPWAGANTATRYFPTYYALTAIPTRVIHDVAGASWLDAARIATTGWLILLSVGLVLLTRRLGLGFFASLATAVLVCSMPMVVVQGTSINNDIAGVAVAVMAVFAWLALREKGALLRLLVSGGLALTAMTIKENSLVAILAIALFEWAHQYQRAQPDDRPASAWRSLRLPVLAAAAVGFGYILLLYILDPLVRGPSSAEAEELVAAAVANYEPQDWGLATAKAYAHLSGGLQTANFIPAFGGAWAQLLPFLATMVIVGSLVYQVMRTSWPWVSSEVAIVAQSAVAYIAAFPILFFLLMKVSGLPLVFQPRYYLPGLVLGAAVLFAGLSRRWAIAALVATCGLYGFMLLEVLAA